MQLAYQVLQIVAPVFALGLIGVAWVKVGWQYDVEFVTRMAMTISVPCLIFMALLRTEIDPIVLRDVALAALGSYAAVAALAWGLVRLAGLELRTYLAPLIFGNTGNIGLPLALFAFGTAGLDFAVVIFAIMAALSFTIGIWMVSGAGSLAQVVREPMVGATLLGGLFMLQGWTIPQWTANTLDLIGQLAIPLMLITLGVAMARLRTGSIGRALWLSLAKLAISLSVSVPLGLWFGLGPVAFGVLVLQISTPVAITSYMLAEKFRANAQEVAGLVVVSTLLAVVAIPVVLTFLI
jgi:malate permease and related proteins